MEQTLSAVYENGVLVLDRPVDLPEHSHVQVTIRPRHESVVRRIGGSIRIDEALARHIAEDDGLLGDD